MKQNKKAISHINLETWNSAVQFVSLLVGGIPCSKPEHFLSVFGHWNTQCCTVLRQCLSDPPVLCVWDFVCLVFFGGF